MHDSQGDLLPELIQSLWPLVPEDIQIRWAWRIIDEEFARLYPSHNWYFNLQYRRWRCGEWRNAEWCAEWSGQTTLLAPEEGTVCAARQLASGKPELVVMQERRRSLRANERLALLWQAVPPPRRSVREWLFGHAGA